MTGTTASVQAALRMLECENAELKEYVAQLEAQLGVTADAPACLGLSPIQARIFSIFVKRGRVTREQLFIGTYGTQENVPLDDNIKVMIYRVRKRIRPFGMDIHTLGHSGYLMPPESRQRARELMQREQEEMAA